jgi:hypothetical protein
VAYALGNRFPLAYRHTARAICQSMPKYLLERGILLRAVQVCDGIALALWKLRGRLLPLRKVFKGHVRCVDWDVQNIRALVATTTKEDEDPAQVPCC